MKRLFAVGMRQWVEVREASSPPKFKETKVVKKGTVRRVATWGYHGPEYVEMPTTTTIKVISRIGGKRLLTMSSKAFKAEFGVGMVEGACIEMMSETHPAILEMVKKEKESSRA